MRQVFFHCQVAVQWRFLRQKADEALRPNRLLPRVDSLDEHLALRLLDDPADDVHRRGLPRPVRPEQAVDTLPRYLKTYVAYRPLYAVTVRQSFHFYYCFFHSFVL